jgi:SAM-dependent methyltransferase
MGVERTDANYDIDSEFYDWVYSDADDVPFYLNLAKRFGGPVLEPMCGTARLMVPLARAGFDVVGIDTHDGMLKQARENISGENAEVRKRIELHKMDMRDFDLKRKFKLVIVGFNGFPHLLEPADQDRAVACMARHLDPTGALVIAVRNLKAPGTVHPEQLDKKKDHGSGHLSRYSTITEVKDHPFMRVKFRYELCPADGRLENRESVFEIRILQANQLKALMEGAGLCVAESYGGHHREQLAPRSDWIVHIARSREVLKDRIAMDVKVV